MALLLMASEGRKKKKQATSYSSVQSAPSTCHSKKSIKKKKSKQVYLSPVFRAVEQIQTQKEKHFVSSYHLIPPTQ